MVIDTSVVIAILGAEPEAKIYAARIEADPVCLFSAVSVLEAGMIAESRGAADWTRELDRILGEQQIRIVPFDEEQADVARLAFKRFGKGRHPAGLNFGDCAVYALSKCSGEPLLFKGDDYARTDVEVVPLS